MRECLIAENGFIWTDGEVYGSVIYLAEGEQKDRFYLVPIEEYEEKLRKEAEEQLAMEEMI